MKRIVSIILITLLVIGGTTLGHTDNGNILNNMEIHNSDDNIITPMYDAHPCHSGYSCGYCELYNIITRSCGCEYHQYRCCCGEKMDLRVRDLINICSTHMPKSYSEEISTFSITEDSSFLHDIQNEINKKQALSIIEESNIKENTHDLSVDTNKSTNDDIITPLYNPHPCHSGITHQECEWWKFTYTCGCIDLRYYCCCGKEVSQEKIYCKNH